MRIDLLGNVIEDKKDAFFYIEELFESVYTFDGDNVFYDLDSNCVSLYDTFQDKLFSDTELYYREFSNMPIWSYSGGHDSDIGIDKFFFEKILNEQKSENLHRHIYLADCHALIGALQDRFLFIKCSFIDFYRDLSKLKGRATNEDSVIWISGQQTSTIFSNLYNIFITLYSTFDLITKIVYELENIKSEFSIYPKLSSSSILFGAKNRLRDIAAKDTIFENCEIVNLIVNIRNELIHNGSWEMNPKIFIQFENNEPIKKWILFPDTENGNLCSYKNRKRFFGKGERINEKLPYIMLETLDRINNTLVMIN